MNNGSIIKEVGFEMSMRCLKSKLYKKKHIISLLILIFKVQNTLC